MCGIAGFISWDSSKSEQDMVSLENAIIRLNRRGPDFQDYKKLGENLGFGHARLSIIDTTTDSNQPLQIDSGRYSIVFNGEIYNYKELRTSLIETFNEVFSTSGDTEVILRMYKHYGKNCLQYFNGFFAFAIYDHEEEEVFIARDRMGIKPLLFTRLENTVYFASEMKALLEFNIPKDLDFVSLKQYFQFSYIPQPSTIFKNVQKLSPGHCMLISRDKNVTQECYYQIPFTKKYSNINYEQAQSELERILEKAVQRRLVSDVSLGSFLSGGIDSSVIATLASRHQPNLNTFSIGFKDNPYFDETKYANLVAKKIKSNHTVFSLTNNDLYENLHDILDYIDEPFADSSAIPVYILSKKTREKVTVALSGDGADEMFGGYNKHHAEYRMMKGGFLNNLVRFGHPVWKILPKSRHSKITNIVRQLERFAEGANLSADERYWRWCSFNKEEYPNRLLKTDTKSLEKDYKARKKEILRTFTGSKDINETLYSDMNLVLVNDMLQKVDSMSMANSLEVRVPFLDHELVNFAFQLKGEFKVSDKGRKTILKDAFRKDLPPELYSRNKMGFEVPLLQWFRSDLKSLICDDLLSDEFVLQQNIFNLEVIKELKHRLFSNNPGEVHAQVWALVVFQSWYKKYMS